MAIETTRSAARPRKARPSFGRKKARPHALLAAAIWAATALSLAAIAVEFVRGFRGAPAPQAFVQPLPAQPHYKVGQPYLMNGVWYSPSEDPFYRRIGVASYYGGELRGIDFHGRPTANGEIYDMHAFSAAHPTLPLPSLVNVTNLENGRSLVLRVNDRGPFVGGRIIDVSRRAAQELGFERQGLARVRVEILAEESRALKDAMLRTTAR